MPAENLAQLATEVLTGNASLTIEQLSALLMLLAISVVLLAMGLGYQIAHAEKRIKALEAACAPAATSQEAM
ncbi:MAG TPA: hypothetical protein IAC01_00915 [Candidatus Limicola stercorigallinarum]|nr:hypothetical protein [Candidatus Limicola stercorigallinarum]